MHHAEGPLNIFVVGKERQSYLTSHIFTSFFFFHPLFEFYIGEKGKESMMDHLKREKEGFLLHWLYIGVCIWLCNICLICKHWHSMENGKISWLWVFSLRAWKRTSVVCGHLTKLQGSLIGYYWVLSHIKIFKQRTYACHNILKFCLWDVRSVFVD